MAYTWRLGGQVHHEEDVVYFSGDSSAHSWAGTIDDESDMTDAEINNYIKNAKPELFEDLRGMKFGSSDIPLTFKPFLDIRRLGSEIAPPNERKRDNHRRVTPSDKLTPSNNVQQNHISFLTKSHKQRPRIHEEELQQGQENQLDQMQDQLKLDGVAQSTVLAVAERLYPRITPIDIAPAEFRNKNIGQESAFSYAPNSKKALSLRALRQLEIKETLAEVSKCERALKAARAQLHKLNERDPSPDASVLITRQPYMEAPDERYKKQGLTRYDRVKSQRLLHKSDCSSTMTSPPSPQTALPATPQYYCYCRETAESSEMIRCSKEWCPIGWFHVQCTGLYRLPYVNERFYCAYCSDDVAPLCASDASEEQSDDSSETLEELTDSVEQGYLDNEIDTEVLFEESPQQSRTAVPVEVSIYEDAEEKLSRGDSSAQARRQQRRLHDKIMKWTAINERTPKRTIKRATMTEIENQSIFGNSTKSSYRNGSDYDQNSDQENHKPFSDASTVRASSSIIPSSDIRETFTNTSNYENDTDMGNEEEDGEHHEERGFKAYEQDYKKQTGLTQPHRYLLTKSANTIEPQPISETSTDLRALIAIQPSTITDTLVPKNYNHLNGLSTLSSSRANQPSQLTSFNHNYNQHSADVSQTPHLAAQVSISRPANPWGTPVNLRDYVPEYDPIIEPTSPSPTSKRKFSTIENEPEEEEEEPEDNGIAYGREADASDEEAFQEGWGEQEHTKVTTFQIRQATEEEEEEGEEEIESNEEAEAETWSEDDHRSVSTCMLH